mgnify:CR=1 FL=1
MMMRPPSSTSAADHGRPLEDGTAGNDDDGPTGVAVDAVGVAAA